MVLTVTCTVQNCSADGCRYTLCCTTLGSGYGNVSYGWSLGGLWSEGPTVLVEKSPPDKLPLTCVAQNPVSSRNTTVVSPAALCAGNGCGKVRGWVAGMGHTLLPVPPALPRAAPWCAKRETQTPGRGTYCFSCSLHSPCRQKTQPTLPPPVSCQTAHLCPALLLSV